MAVLAPNGPAYQAGTLSGNPVATAAGLATVQVLTEMNPYAELERLAAHYGRTVRTHRDGSRSFYIESPGGRWMEFIAYPPSSIYAAQAAARSAPPD